MLLWMHDTIRIQLICTFVLHNRHAVLICCAVGVCSAPMPWTCAWIYKCTRIIIHTLLTCDYAEPCHNIRHTSTKNNVLLSGTHTKKTIADACATQSRQITKMNIPNTHKHTHWNHRQNPKVYTFQHLHFVCDLPHFPHADEFVHHFSRAHPIPLLYTITRQQNDHTNVGGPHTAHSSSSRQAEAAATTRHTTSDGSRGKTNRLRQRGRQMMGMEKGGMCGWRQRRLFDTGYLGRIRDLFHGILMREVGRSEEQC